MNKRNIKIPFRQWVNSQIRFKVLLENVRTPFGEPFNNNNHWVKTLNEYEAGVYNYKKSSLYRFHKNFKPNNIHEVYGLNSISDHKNIKINSYDNFTLGEYPWGRWTSRTGREEWLRSVHCGPSSDRLIEKEWNSFTNLYKKIKKEGFNYLKYGNPLGIFFINNENKSFFIILGGNHRAAIAYFLGIKYIYVRKLPRDYISSQVVKFKHIKNNNNSVELFNKILSEEFYKWTD